MYCFNLVVSFQIGFVLEHDYKKRLLLDGFHVARFYILRGSFIIDAMAVLPVVYQVHNRSLRVGEESVGVLRVCVVDVIKQ